MRSSCDFPIATQRLFRGIVLKQFLGRGPGYVFAKFDPGPLYIPASPLRKRTGCNASLGLSGLGALSPILDRGEATPTPIVQVHFFDPDIGGLKRLIEQRGWSKATAAGAPGVSLDVDSPPKMRKSPGTELVIQRFIKNGARQRGLSFQRVPKETAHTYFYSGASVRVGGKRARRRSPLHRRARAHLSP